MSRPGLATRRPAAARLGAAWLLAALITLPAWMALPATAAQNQDTPSPPPGSISSLSRLAAARRDLQQLHAVWMAALESGSSPQITRFLTARAAPGFTFHRTQEDEPADLAAFLAWETQQGETMVGKQKGSIPTGTPTYTIQSIQLTPHGATEEGAFHWARRMTDAQGQPLLEVIQTPQGSAAVNETGSFSEMVRIEWLRTPSGWKIQSFDSVGMTGIL